MRPRAQSILKAALLQAALVLATLVVVDVGGWYLLPDWIADRFTGYRAGAEDGRLAGRGGYPRGYFEANATRGFDIRPNRRGTHRVEGRPYRIWSNELGCFDHAWPTVPDDYFYFAGDSFTWGYAPYEVKFATIFEAESGKPSLKCGVTHTGTRHQLDKFRHLLGQIGHAPERVVVGYYPNDIANDYLHPHTTVIAGWQVDEIFLDEENNGVRVDRGFIESFVARSLDPTRSASLQAVRNLGRRYSISAHLIRELTSRAGALLSRRPGALAVAAEEAHVYEGEPIRSVYALDSMFYGPGPLRYPDSRFTRPNRDALVAWRQHAEANDYELTLLLIPPPRYYDTVDFFSELRAFLADHGIQYIDLAQELRTSQPGREGLYWAHDEHLSPGGNRLVAELLAERLIS